MLVTLTIKGGREHTAPFHRDLIPLYDRAMEEKRTHLIDLPENASSLFWKFFKRHGYGHLSIHCTRVTVITRLIRAGYTTAQVMEYVGHCSEEVNAIYRKLKASDVSGLGEAL